MDELAIKVLELHQGTVSVSLTDRPGTRRVPIRNVFPPDVDRITALVRIDGAEAGMEVLGRWLQLGVVQTKAEGLTPEGAVVSEASFTMTPAAIRRNGTGGGRLYFTPNRPLPPDSYQLQVFVDGRLARTLGFVVVSQDFWPDWPRPIEVETSRSIQSPRSLRELLENSHDLEI
jgi:hypothetical protein